MNREIKFTEEDFKKLKTGDKDSFDLLYQDYYLVLYRTCLLYTSPSPRDRQKSRMPSSA